MIAKKIELRCDKAFVVIEGEGFQDGALITIDGIHRNSLADGIVRMVNESQCVTCGKFNGLHGEVFFKTGQNMGGGVEGHYKMCPHAESK